MASAVILNLLLVAIFDILPFLHYHFQPSYKLETKAMTTSSHCTVRHASHCQLSQQKKTFLPIHVAEKIRKSSVWNLILCSGAIWHLNMGAQPHIVPYKKRWKHFWKLHGLIDFWCAQTLALLCTFGTTTTNWLFFVAPLIFLYGCTSIIHDVKGCRRTFLSTRF